jgi:16S rRNA (uracil1498-N3)-methyltransferase
VTVFDGAGREVMAEIAVAARKGVKLVVQEVRPLTVPAAQLVLAQAIPKGKTMEMIIEKAVELGVSEIYPLLTDRTVVRLDGMEARRKQEKWQRIAIEACKQCGQNWLPQVRVPLSFGKFLEQQPAVDLSVVAALDPSARKLQDWIGQMPTRPQSACVLVGPEGDFTPGELALALGAGFRPWSLGKIILRSETAALYTLSVLGHELGRASALIDLQS